MLYVELIMVAVQMLGGGNERQTTIETTLLPLVYELAVIW